MAGQEYCPKASEVVNIASTDHTFTLAVQAILIGGAGNIVVRFMGDATDRTIAVIAGQLLRGAFTKVTKTNTTATGMLGLTDYAQAVGV